MPTERDFAATAREHQPKLYRTACFLTGIPQEAENLVQETLVEAWRGWDAFEGRSSPHIWLYQILITRYHLWQRKQGGSPGFFSFGRTSSSPTTSKPHSALMEQNHHSSQLWGILEPLQSKHREAMVLRYAEEMNVEQIAETLRVPASTVKTRLIEAHTQLAEQLKRAVGVKPKP